MASERGDLCGSRLAVGILCGQSCHQVTDGVQWGGREVGKSACVYINIYIRVWGGSSFFFHSFSTFFVVFSHTSIHKLTLYMFLIQIKTNPHAKSELSFLKSEVGKLLWLMGFLGGIWDEDYSWGLNAHPSACSSKWCYTQRCVQRRN